MATEVTRTPVTPQLAALNPAPVLFDRVNIIAIEEGQPKNKFSANLNWKLGPWGATARATRYGKTMTLGTTAALDFQLGAKTIEGRSI